MSSCTSGPSQPLPLQPATPATAVAATATEAPSNASPTGRHCRGTSLLLLLGGPLRKGCTTGSITVSAVARRMVGRRRRIVARALAAGYNGVILTRAAVRVWGAMSCRARQPLPLPPATAAAALAAAGVRGRGSVAAGAGGAPWGQVVTPTKRQTQGGHFLI